MGWTYTNITGLGPQSQGSVTLTHKNRKRSFGFWACYPRTDGCRCHLVGHVQQKDALEPSNLPAAQTTDLQIWCIRLDLISCTSLFLLVFSIKKKNMHFHIMLWAKTYFTSDHSIDANKISVPYERAETFTEIKNGLHREWRRPRASMPLGNLFKTWIRKISALVCVMLHWSGPEDRRWSSAFV